MTYQLAGTLSAPGEAVAIANAPNESAQAIAVFLSGTYTSGSVAFELGLDSQTGPWFPIQARRASDGLVTQLSGDLGANGSSAWTIPTLGAKYVRVRCVGLASGSITVNQVSPAPTFDASPATYVNAAITPVTAVIMGQNGPLTVAAGTSDLYVPWACRILTVIAGLHVAPTVTAAIFDVNLNGTTIFTNQMNRPTISAGTFYDVSGPPDVTDLALGDHLSVDVDQIGSGLPGSTLALSVWLQRL